MFVIILVVVVVVYFAAATLCLFVRMHVRKPCDIGNGGIVYWNQLNTIRKIHARTPFSVHEIRLLNDCR